MRIRDVTTPRLTHSVAEAGHGGDPLLLLHGFTGAKEDFADVLDPFADRGRHAVAPDHRGHGGSDQPAEEDAYTFEQMADDAWALLDALELGRVDLLGHSMGGMVAQLMALADRGRLRSLVLMNTCGGRLEQIDPEVAAVGAELARTVGLAELNQILESLRTSPRPLSEERVRNERPGYIEFGVRKLLSSSPAMYASMAQRMATVDDRLDALSGLDLPTLVVVGAEDDEFLAPSRALADAIPGARLEVIDDAAHSPQFENPDRWWKVVNRFLDEVRADAPSSDSV